jgi:hypothetical protein
MIDLNQTSVDKGMWNSFGAIEIFLVLSIGWLRGL